MPGGRPIGGSRRLPGRARGATGRPPPPRRRPPERPPGSAAGALPAPEAPRREAQPAGGRRGDRAGGRGRPRAPRNSPGPGGPLGIIPWLARAAALSRAPAALGTEGGRRPGAAGRAGGTGAAAAARRGSRARRRKGRATMCRGEEAAEARAARTLPLGGGGRGLQEIPAPRQEIGILTKHSRPRGRSAPGAPASLNPWPAGTRRGRAHSGLGVGGGVLRQAGLGVLPLGARPAPPPAPASSVPRGGRAGMCPDQNLALRRGLSEHPPPLPQHQERALSFPFQWRMNLPSPGRVPCFQ